MKTKQTVSERNFESIRFSLSVSFLISCAFIMCVNLACAVGITPEEIFQQKLDPSSILGTWEKLPEVNPLAEKSGQKTKSGSRTLMTLRKDGTCRVFSGESISGIDGIWKLENHDMVITLPGSIDLEFFVYGIKGDFMVTRSPINNGVDQLWSRVK